MSTENNISNNEAKRNAAKAHLINSKKSDTTSVGAYIGLFVSLALIVVYIGYSLFVQFGVITTKEKNPDSVSAEELSQTLDQYISYMGENGDPVGLYYDTYLKKQEEAAKAQEEAAKTEEASEAQTESESEKASEEASSEKITEAESAE